MKRGIIAAAIAAIIAIGTPLESLAQEVIQPYIRISTTVQKEVTPNEIYLRITINEKDYKGKKTLEQMQEALIGALKINRIDIPECLSLNYMGSEIEYKSFSRSIKPKSEATYTLKLHDAATMQSVIAELEKRQISNIELAGTKFTNEQGIKGELGTMAMQQAKAEAQQLAGAIGQEIGKALSISSYLNSNQIQPRLYKARNAVESEDAALMSSSVAPTISIGKITYNFTVEVRFELK